MVSGIIAPLFVGIVGGLSANFLANTAWDYYNRPILAADDSLDLTFDYSEEGDLKFAHYSIVIENSGKRPARNCSANMILDGRTDGIHYHYEGRLPWENGNQQMTINPNQRAKLAFCRADYADLAGVILFPSEGEWNPSKVSLIAGKEGDKYKPIKEYWEGQDKVWPAAGFSSRELVEGNWEENRVVITSENGGALIIKPEYTHPDGFHGMEARLNSSYESRYP